MLTLGIPNGSLHEATIFLLAKIGIEIVVQGRKFEAEIKNSDIFTRAVIMRPQDMPEALVDGLLDAAIYGYDWHKEVSLSEKRVNKLRIVKRLDYSKKTDGAVSVVLFGKSEKLIDNHGMRVTTEYPNLTAGLFKKATIRFSHGGTEQKVAYGKYHYGVGVTETGASLTENGLATIKTIMVSPVVFVARKKTVDMRRFGELLAGGLKSHKYRLIKMNVMGKNLSAVLKILPALKAPTVNKLADKNYAVETVIPKDQISDFVVALKKLGVSGILVQNLDIVC